MANSKFINLLIYILQNFTLVVTLTLLNQIPSTYFAHVQDE
jgi:hypothetical protein